jgi:hypothetical protein
MIPVPGGMIHEVSPAGLPFEANLSACFEVYYVICCKHPRNLLRAQIITASYRCGIERIFFNGGTICE